MTELSGLLVLRPKKTRAGDHKRFDLVRIHPDTDVHDALRDLDEEDYAIVNLDHVKTYRPHYKTVQENRLIKTGLR